MAGVVVVCKATPKLSLFLQEDSGVTLVEYGIALILAIAIGTAALGTLATAIDGQLADATVCLGGTAAGGDCS